MTEIAPRIVDGEPTCSKECPVWTRFECGIPKPRDCSRSWNDDPCIPGLRRQRDALAAECAHLRNEIAHPHDAAEFEALRRERDAARRELCEAKEWTESRLGSRPCDTIYTKHTATEYAASRSWSYLYAPAPPATGTEEGGEG